MVKINCVWTSLLFFKIIDQTFNKGMSSRNYTGKMIISKFMNSLETFIMCSFQKIYDFCTIWPKKDTS